jgi:hypothetical protein
MKRITQLTRNLSVFIISALFMLTLTKCQTEEVKVEEHEHFLEYKKEVGSFAKFNLKETTASLKIFNKETASKSNLSTQSTEDGFYFIIDTTKVVKMSNGFTQSYTIKVKNSLTPVNSFQNLVITQFPNNITRAYLYTYFPDQNFKNNISTNPDIDFTGNAKISLLDVNNIRYQVQSCSSITLTLCDYNYTHIAGPRCGTTYDISIPVCVIDNGLDAPTGGSLNSSGNTNTSSPNLGGAYAPFLGSFTRPLVPDIDLTDILGAEAAGQYNFIQSNLVLNSKQVSWVTANAERVALVFNYLEQNNTSQESKELVKKAITRMIQNPNLFKNLNPFIIQKQIDDSQLPPCAKAIVAKIKNLQQNDFATIIAKLGGANMPYTVKIVLNSDLNGTSVLATTKPVAGTNLLEHEIGISPNYLNTGTQISIASTIIHELIHSYFLSIINENIYNTQHTFPYLWNYYINNGSGNGNLAEHNEMANSYVNIIASALQEFNTNVPVTSNSQIQQFYKDLAWGGLEGTIPYNTPLAVGGNLSDADRNRIDAVNMSNALNIPTINTNTNQFIQPTGQPCQ